MHIRVLAPLLSAALSMSASGSSCMPAQTALRARRPRPAARTCCATADGTGEIVTVSPSRASSVSSWASSLRRAADVLAVARVLDQALDLDRDGLGRLAADDRARQRALRPCLRRPASAHDFTCSPSCRAARAARSSGARCSCAPAELVGLTAWPVARCMRSANCSLRSFSSSSSARRTTCCGVPWRSCSVTVLTFISAPAA